MHEVKINQNPYLYTNKIFGIKNNKGQNTQAPIPKENAQDQFTSNNKSDLRKDFEETKKQQGIIGKAWDGIKNIFGAKSGSKHIEKVIKQAERGEISQEEAQETLNKYKEGQKTCVDVVADLTSGILAVGAFALAVPTGGASLAVGLGLATAVGAGVKVGIKAGDAIATGKEYAGKDLLYDTLTGGINGVLAPITNGLGNTVTKTIGKKLGLKIIQEGAEEAAEQGIKLGIKQTAKNIVLNQTIDVAEGTIGKRALALGAGMAIDGALGGASDNMLRAGLNGENVIEAGIQGAIGGAIMAPVIGGGFRAAGKAGKAINNKITTKIVLPDGINTKFKQGQTGDCALLSTIDGMMNNPNTAKTFKKSITKTISGDYNVKIGDKIVKVAKSSLSDEMLSDKTGIRIFEQAYKQLTGDIDGGFAEVVAKQFGLNPVHIANESITDELLDTLATNKSNTVLSLGTLVDTDGAISPIGSQRHYFTIKDIDSAKKTVKLTSPIDTSKTIELSYDDVKALGISIDGGSIKELKIPNEIRSSNDTKFKGINNDDKTNHVLGYDAWGEESVRLREDMRTRLLINSGLLDSSLELSELTQNPNITSSGFAQVVEKLSQIKTKQGTGIYENILPTNDNRGIRCKTVLSGRNKGSITFRLKKLQENGIDTIIDLRSKGECSTAARNAVDNLGLKYVNFPVEDGNWNIESLARMSEYIHAVNSGNYCIGCANGQARTDLAIAINYIFNPKSSNIPPNLYYGSKSSSRVSVQQNVNQILGLISQNPEIVFDFGYKSYEEFTNATQERFTKLIKKIK